MKYCEVVRDLANKSGDWSFYDEQFRYLRQSSPELYPWDQIHWELWLLAMTNFRTKSQSFSGSDRTITPRGRFRTSTPPFPKGTCWSFHSGRHCRGCQHEHAVRNIQPPSAKTKTPNCEQIPLSPEHQFQLSLRGNSLVTPLRVDRFEQLLAGYDQALKQYLINGFRFGFRINFTGEITSFEAPNLKSALQNPDTLFSKLSKDLDAGRIAGPFDTAPFPVFRTSPVGIVPKKVPNEFRLIHHLSYSKGLSINDSIPDDCSSVQYATITDAVNILQRLGPGSYLAKPDIKLAFRIIPVRPLDYPLLGIKWDNQFYFDRCLAMGLKSSCAIFGKI